MRRRGGVAVETVAVEWAGLVAGIAGEVVEALIVVEEVVVVVRRVVGGFGGPGSCWRRELREGGAGGD